MLLRPSHTIHETGKDVAIFHTYYNFLSQLQQFFQHFFYMSNDFLTDFFRKIFAVLCVVCKGRDDNIIVVFHKLSGL